MKCFICLNTKKFKTLKFSNTKNILCLKCGLVFISQRTIKDQQYYKEDGYFKKSPNIAYKKIFFSKSLLSQIAKSRIESSLKIFQADLKNKKILEVGCGYGEILYILKKQFKSNVMGIEASPETALFGSKVFKIPIQAQLLEEFKTKDRFDIIWCAHTLEHVNDPNAFLHKIKKILKKDGLLFIEVPNILKPTGNFDLNSFLYSEHLQNFSAYNLNLLLKKNQFKIVAYSEENFLKFWCQTGQTKTSIIPDYSAIQIFNFLKNYQQRYNFFDYIKVYTQKGIYGINLLIHKVYDILEV